MADNVAEALRTSCRSLRVGKGASGNRAAALAAAGKGTACPRETPERGEAAPQAAIALDKRRYGRRRTVQAKDGVSYGVVYSYLPLLFKHHILRRPKRETPPLPPGNRNTDDACVSSQRIYFLKPVC